MITWPRDMVVDLARRRAVLVLGAGVSMNSSNDAGRRPKNWAAFLEHAVGRMNAPKALKTATKRLVSEGDYLTACDVVRDNLGLAAFSDLAREEFLDPQFRPADIHKHIEQIDSRVVVTPNFDKIYDQYVSSRQNNSVILKTYRDHDLAEAIRLTQRVVVKIHGTVDAPSDMIFTRGDYARARAMFRSFYEILSALVLTHTFVFVGCGLSDPDTALLLEDYAFSHPYGRHHYLITGKSTLPRPEIRKVFERARHLTFVQYDEREHHKELTASLAVLAEQVSAERANLATTLNW